MVRPVQLRIAAILLLMAAVARGEEPAPPRLLGPRSPEARSKALSREGGTKKTEEAVERGLDWLARHQQSDGAWDADGFARRCEQGSPKCEGIGKGQHGEAMPCPFDHAISALATLAFLGHGHLPGADGDPHGETVEKALLRLKDPRDSWSLCLSTQAFAEAEAMEGRGRWRVPLEAGVKRLLAMRGEDGAFGYFPAGRGSDVPLTALAVQALVAARDAGVALPKDLGAGVDRFLGSLEEKSGKLAYIVNGRRFGYTPTSTNAHLALAVRALLETGTAGARHKAHRALVLKQKPVWKISFKTVNVPGRGKVPVQIGNLSMYQWWYGTIALFQRGGSDWKGWFAKTRSALQGNQGKKDCARGSWNPEGTYERQTGGRVFATALGVLMLEQPYRHRRLGD
jgi:hypothetical protein